MEQKIEFTTESKIPNGSDILVRHSRCAPTSLPRLAAVQPLSNTYASMSRKFADALTPEPPVTRPSPRSFLLAWFALTLAAHSAAAQSMTIRADLTEAPRGLIRGTLSLPVNPGPLTLVYPQWIPGYHGPIGPITDLAGLKFTA